MGLIVDIKKRLGDFELEVGFEADNEMMALLGASGCGKSMTLKCIAGIEKPDEGYISLNDRVLFDSGKKISLTPQMRRVGYLFQQYALFPNMTVRENIAAGVRRENRAHRDEIVQAQLVSMHLEDVQHSRPHQLSGGQQQRCALARILGNAPELILLDEPFSALDSYLKWQVEMELSDMLRDYTGECIFVSHDRDEVYRSCDSVCVMTRGRSEAKTAVKELFRAPRTLAACLITGCKNYSAAKRVNETHFAVPDWGITAETEQGSAAAAYVGVRAHDVLPGEGKNELQCTVERHVEELFGDVLMLRTPGGGLLRMESESGALSGVRRGERITVHIEAEKIMLLEE